MAQCFSVKLIISPPPELASRLPQVLKELKERLLGLSGCRCSGGSYLYVCACRETLLKTLLVQTQGVPMLKEGSIPGGPSVEIILTSSNPQDLVLVLDIILETTKGHGLPFTFTD